MPGELRGIRSGSIRSLARHMVELAAAMANVAKRMRGLRALWLVAWLIIAGEISRNECALNPTCG